jgi:4-hydroxy-4-methyl-2-oxoglutarate aldolase
MAEPPGLTIRREWKRPAKEAFAALADVSTGVIVDALGREGALDYGIKPVISTARFIGTALTVATTARDNLAPYACLKVSQPGDVVVVTTGDFTKASVSGDIMIGMFRNAGIVAVVTDGLVRDTAGLEEVGIPVFARGISPNSPFKNGPGSVGLPITIGGVLVSPGDIVVGDADGVAVVPASRLQDVIREVENVKAKEAKADASVRNGIKLPDWIDAALEQKGVHWV